MRCLEKPFGIATSQRYEKGYRTVCHTVYEAGKTPMWMKTGRKRKSFSVHIGRKLFGLMNSVIIENLGIVNIKFKTFHTVGYF